MPISIKEASQKTQVSASTIRYYEKEMLIPAIKRNESGIREIDENIIGRINFIKQMRAAGMTIESLKSYISLFDAQEDNTKRQLSLLEEQREIMLEKRDDLQDAIDHLTYKIENYDNHMRLTEERLTQLEKEN
ncbi:MerR family transcriptional regulator [Holzapfeliella floricola]|uniref:MerR family transcriptional regulator protein n=1 Tax=Holzapfeliella floricola DSM 23037 = JCM 16512 TaxID=1423744 RepID=A0A0R2DKL8_9LACO|nr:MerR family transcriptional regulator protein [Holzapfeliella floricola DSM 23037 = JCM 16512]